MTKKKQMKKFQIQIKDSADKIVRTMKFEIDPEKTNNISVSIEDVSGIYYSIDIDFDVEVLNNLIFSKKFKGYLKSLGDFEFLAIRECILKESKSRIEYGGIDNGR